MVKCSSTGLSDSKLHLIGTFKKLIFNSFSACWYIVVDKLEMCTRTKNDSMVHQIPLASSKLFSIVFL